MAVTEFYFVLRCVDGFLLLVTGFLWVVPGFTGFYRFFLLCLARFHMVLLNRRSA